MGDWPTSYYSIFLRSPKRWPHIHLHQNLSPSTEAFRLIPRQTQSSCPRFNAMSEFNHSRRLPDIYLAHLR